MIDINLIRERPDYVKEALKKKMWDADFTDLLSWDKEKRELMQVVENNKAEMNKLSATVPQLKKEGKDVKPVFEKVKEIAAKK
jgi:seryl-tRNA synthetase